MAIANIEMPREQIADLCRRYAIQRLAVFGSALRDDFGPQSDVDVLVEFRPDAHIGFLNLCKMQRELSALLRRSVDLVPQDGLKPVIRDEILSSAKEIYAA